MRKILYTLHSYCSLLALIPLIIVSITGSILVFKTEIDQWLMPKAAALGYHQSQHSSIARLNHNVLQETVEERFPDFIIGSWEIFNDGQEADRVYLIKKGTDQWHKIYFDPFSNKVLSDPVTLTSTLTDWLLNLHYTFMLNGIGGEHTQWGTLIGLLAAVILTFLGVSGLIIHRKFWVKLFQLRIKKSLRIISGDLHRLVGAWSAPVILILGITGMYFNAIEYYHEVFEHAGEAHYKPTAPLYAQHIDFQSLLDDTQTHLPDFTATYLLYPFEPDVDVTVFGYQPGLNPFASLYASTVTYNRETGKLIAAVDGREATIATQVFDSFRELHFGSFGGIASKLLWCVLGLAPFILAMTGLTVWLLRRMKAKVAD